MEPGWTIEPLIAGGALQAAVTLARRGREIILVDTGYQRQEELLLRQLSLRGIAAGDITCIANTHLHFDHSHNNCLFPNAVILCSREDHQWTTSLCNRIMLPDVTLEDIFHYYPELQTRERAPRAIWGLIKALRRFWSEERLGPGQRLTWLEQCRMPEGMRAIPSPGHVPHHFSFAFETSGDAVLVAGDAIITREPESEDPTTFPPTDGRQYAATKAALGRFPGLIIPGHDAPFAGFSVSAVHGRTPGLPGTRESDRPVNRRRNRQDS